MNSKIKKSGSSKADELAMPAIVGRAEWQAQLDELLVREKAHTHEGDAIAAARRRLPMVEIDSSLELTGPHGTVTLLDTFEGRRQLIAYYHMWFSGETAANQCEGCTFFNGQVRELAYLHSCDITYATFCQGPYNESLHYRDFMGWDVPWYSATPSLKSLLGGKPSKAGPLICYLRDGDRVFETFWTRGRGLEPMAPTYGLLDMTVYGRQEDWEESPSGWPRAHTFRTNGRPTAQWPRIEAGRPDKLAD
jgi:predicted dithiol-disulfide oxidoreductase (DUF899 family)